MQITENGTAGDVENALIEFLLHVFGDTTADKRPPIVNLHEEPVLMERLLSGKSLPASEVVKWSTAKRRLLYEIILQQLALCAVNRAAELPPGSLDETNSTQIGHPILFGMARHPWPLGKPRVLQ